MCGVAGVLDLAGLRMVPEEIIPHLWEENQEGMFERLRGQFAVPLWDVRRHQLTLGRDRFGTGWLPFENSCVKLI
jgi:hypothetical protein